MPDRTYDELQRLLQEASPLIFDGLTGTVFNEGLIELECERIDALADAPGDPPVTSEEYRRAGRHQIATLRAYGLNPPSMS